MKILGKTQSEIDAEKAAERKQKEISENLIYLSFTDWYATRQFETGKLIPEEIVEKRNAARDRISELRKLD